MKPFLATVLSVIAVGVLLIAYGLLAPRASGSSQLTYDPQTGTYSLARPMFASERVALSDAGGSAYGYQGAPVLYSTPVGYRPAVYTAPVEYPAQAAAVRTYRAPRAASASQRTTVTRVERAPGRNWKKTALVIGGSTATGAGIGGLISGKKGALIGAAIGGGASTLWESQH